MATTKTRAELVYQALANLCVLEAGQTPSDEDASTVDGYVDSMLARLNAEEIVSVTDDEAIDEAIFKQLAVVLADDAAFEFGLPGVPGSASNPDQVGKAIKSLRVIGRAGPTRETLATDYF